MYLKGLGLTLCFSVPRIRWLILRIIQCVGYRKGSGRGGVDNRGVVSRIHGRRRREKRKGRKEVDK